MGGEKTITVGVEKSMGFQLEVAKDGTHATLTGPTRIDSELFAMLRSNIQTALGNLEANKQIPSGCTGRLMASLEQQATKVTEEMQREKGQKAMEGGPPGR